MPEEKVVNLGGSIQGFPRTPIVADVSTGDPLPGKSSINDMFNGMLSSTKVSGAPNIPLSSFIQEEVDIKKLDHLRILKRWLPNNNLL